MYDKDEGEYWSWCTLETFTVGAFDSKPVVYMYNE